MSASLSLAVQALTVLVPLVRDLIDVAKTSDTPPTPAQAAALNDALDKADAAIQSA